MSAMRKFSYGLFVLSAKAGDKDGGCIINTAMQVTTNPVQVSMCLNKDNYTHELIMNSKEFNVSFLSEDVPFSVFQRFGFQSGRDVDKFADFADCARAENGVMYLTKYANAAISVKVNKTVDLGTHTMFIGQVSEEKELSSLPSVTYQYYFDHIKPKPETAETPKKGWVCKICGYVYEGEELPPDFICPICKHGAEDFEPIG
ncbi:flavin reductase (DIM6/NTAB) family NADH-FMN oxidoreductase RutF [Clostridiales Family XIII bacterium PM5-7]